MCHICGQAVVPEHMDRPPGWFTTAYFHDPSELPVEADAAGLTVRQLVGLEGLPGWLRQLGIFSYVHLAFLKRAPR